MCLDWTAVKIAYVLSEKWSFQSIINIRVRNWRIIETYLFYHLYISSSISLYLNLTSRYYLFIFYLKEQIFIIINNNYTNVLHIEIFK